MRYNLWLLIGAFMSAAQPAHAPDAAARRQDRRHFEGCVYSIAFPIYPCGAGDGQPVGPPLSMSLPRLMPQNHRSDTLGLFSFDCHSLTFEAVRLTVPLERSSI